MIGLILLLVLVSMAGLTALTIFLARKMGGLFRRTSGWDALAKTYPGPLQTPADTRTGAIKIGNVYFRYGPRFCSTADGFFMVYKSVYSYPPLLIPWQAFKSQKKTLLFWRSACCLAIGNPVITTLTVWENIFNGMKPFLPASLKGGE